MPQILFRNLNLLDPRWNEPRGGYEVLVEGEAGFTAASEDRDAEEVADAVGRLRHGGPAVEVRRHEMVFTHTTLLPPSGGKRVTNNDQPVASRGCARGVART